MINKDRCEKLRKHVLEAKRNGGVTQIKLDLPDYLEKHEILYRQFVQKYKLEYIKA